LKTCHNIYPVNEQEMNEQINRQMSLKSFTTTVPTVMENILGKQLLHNTMLKYNTQVSLETSFQVVRFLLSSGFENSEYD